MSIASLPLADPGVPDLRSPGRYLLWVARGQVRLLAIGTFWGIIWMVAQAAVPAALGVGIQSVADGDNRRLALAAAAVLVLGVLQAGAGVLRHRQAVTNWVTASSRTQQLVVRQATHLGAELSLEVATGEVVAVTSSDVEKIGSAFDVLARFIGGVVAFIAVALVLLRTSPALGIMVLVGVPLLMAGVGPLLKPLERRESEQRRLLGRATEMAADTVAGLRVLRGIGGEDIFVQRFKDASQEVRFAAVEVARVRSVLESLQVALPGLFLVTVTWWGARLVLSGQLSVGQLVAFYGYTAFLVLPLRTFTEAAQRWTSAYVASRRVVRVLSIERVDTDNDSYDAAPDFAGADLHDPTSGLTIRGGVFTAIVCDDQALADALANRLGGFGAAGGEVQIAGRALDDLPRAVVRTAILVQDKDPVLMSGTLGELFDVPRSNKVRIQDAVATASAYDVLDAVIDATPEVSDPLLARITERGRSLSGGQRQRLALARSLVADPAVLVLDEPTSAVDAHTEARIAENLTTARAGRTTVVLTSSPLVLDRADEVHLVVGDRVVATGRHRALLKSDPTYRAIITREEVSTP